MKSSDYILIILSSTSIMLLRMSNLLMYVLKLDNLNLGLSILNLLSFILLLTIFTIFFDNALENITYSIIIAMTLAFIANHF